MSSFWPPVLGRRSPTKTKTGREGSPDGDSQWTDGRHREESGTIGTESTTVGPEVMVGPSMEVPGGRSGSKRW